MLAYSAWKLYLLLGKQLEPLSVLFFVNWGKKAPLKPAIPNPQQFSFLYLQAFHEVWVCGWKERMRDCLQPWGRLGHRPPFTGWVRVLDPWMETVFSIDIQLCLMLGFRHCLDYSNINSNIELLGALTYSTPWSRSCNHPHFTGEQSELQRIFLKQKENWQQILAQGESSSTTKKELQRVWMICLKTKESEHYPHFKAIIQKYLRLWKAKVLIAKNICIANSFLVMI